MLLVHHFLENSAKLSPDKTALICNNQRLTYAEIDAMANRMANALIDHGVKRGDRVVLYLHNSIELVAGIFAALKAGATFVVINEATKPDKLLYMVRNCRATAIVLPANQPKVAENILKEAESVQFAVLTGKPGKIEIKKDANHVTFDSIQASYPDTKPKCLTIDQDLACLIYTSGSTGYPKGVMSGHNNVVFAASSIISYLENRPDDIVINALPLSFDYGLYQLLMTFKFGGTLVLERSLAYPAQFLKMMEKEKVTGLPGVPTLFAILLKMDLSVYDLSSLRYITNTAAALPVNHIQELQDKFPLATIYSMYGLTETKRTLYLPPDQLKIRPESVGIPIPGTEAWIENDQGNRVGADQIGELVVRGGHVMRGYWENPEASAKHFRPGFTAGEQVCCSGDLFRMDDEGYFYFIGRKDDIIKSRGEKVAPKEVESILYAICDVVEAAVIGTPDPIFGEAIKAFVVLKQGSNLTQKEVLRHCRANMEDFMVPKIIELCDTLPKNQSGKIHKLELS